jgi:hypothetical protein
VTSGFRGMPGNAAMTIIEITVKDDMTNGRRLGDAKWVTVPVRTSCATIITLKERAKFRRDAVLVFALLFKLFFLGHRARPSGSTGDNGCVGGNSIAPPD